jgi:hypothetical protein
MSYTALDYWNWGRGSVGNKRIEKIS